MIKTISGEDEPESKSIFVKVPLKDDPTFASVNVRELVMFTDVLPKLQVNNKLMLICIYDDVVYTQLIGVLQM